jgi:hypothetical protein
MKLFIIGFISVNLLIILYKLISFLLDKECFSCENCQFRSTLYYPGAYTGTANIIKIDICVKRKQLE